MELKHTHPSQWQSVWHSMHLWCKFLRYNVRDITLTWLFQDARIFPWLCWNRIRIWTRSEWWEVLEVSVCPHSWVSLEENLLVFNLPKIVVIVQVRPWVQWRGGELGRLPLWFIETSDAFKKRWLSSTLLKDIIWFCDSFYTASQQLSQSLSLSWCRFK